MTTHIATRFNTKFKAFYKRLKVQGKQSKVAVVAPAWFITILNHRIKTDQDGSTLAGILSMPG